MSVSFDDPPLYDNVTRNSPDRLSHVWIAWFSTFIDTLSSFLSQNGIFVPKLTTTQRDALQSVTDGQLIYNTTSDQFQGRRAGAWVNL